eukprot:TRINITY_DN6024_c0_g1_i1.p1 TRINITY_DN6024_c0_g1~~TRINITY_DN6024_c0_g1_i1.p1  ORF type:complete len:479 (-),score=71.96 TRINITY_DN6024_c0_g1_i1:120-1556(-)
MSKWSLRFLSYESIYSNKEDDHVVIYSVLVSNSEYEWVISKRFKEFFDLHKYLSKKYNGLPEFPSRIPKLFIGRDELVERKNNLQFYFDGLDNELYSECEELREFLCVNKPKKARPVPDGVVMQLPQDVISFEDQILSAHEIIEISPTNSLYLPSVYSTAKESLKQVNDLKKTLDNIFGVQERLDYIAKTEKPRRDLKKSFSTTIELCTHTIDRINSGKGVEPFLRIFVVKAMPILTEAHNWCTQIHKRVFEEVEFASAGVNFIKAHQVKAEADITLLMQLSNEGSLSTQQKQEDILKGLNELLAQLKTEMSQLKSENSSDLLIDRYVDLIKYIDSGIQTYIDHKNSNSAQYRIQSCEKKLFEILEKVSSWTKEDPSPSEYKIVKQEIQTLTTDLAALRGKLSKQAQENEDAHDAKAYINRIEDMQENVSDMVYNYVKKYEQMGLNAKEEAKQIIANKQVEIASSKHIREHEDDLFEL